MKMQSNRPGFALPLAILVIGILTVGVATAFSRTDVEAKNTDHRQAQADAFAMAQAGLERFATDRFALGFITMPPAAKESIRFTLPNGYTDVVSRRVRDKTATEDGMYVIMSRAVMNAGLFAWTPRTVHTVGQYAYYREGQIKVMAGWTSLAGLRKNGGSGSISGVDNCGKAPDVAGAATPDSMFIQNGGSLTADGTPDTLYMGTKAQMGPNIGIDWDGIVNHNLIVPDIVIPGDAFPPEAAFSDPNYWPVIRIDQSNFSVPYTGQGTIIATGDLTIAGGDKWRGIVLVGGNLTSDGNNTVLGATISGLNELLGITVPINDVGNGTKTFQYDSCNVAKATNRYSAMLLIPNTWVDNWKAW